MRTGTAGQLGRWVLVALGVLSIIFTLFEAAFNGSKFTESILRGYTSVRIDDTILRSPNYVFERWLVIAVVVTIALNVVFYFTNFFSAIELIWEEAKKGGAKPWPVFIPLVVFPMVSFYFGVLLPWDWLKQYYVTPGSMGDLKKATTTLLILFVAYDLFMVWVGRHLESTIASDAKSEAKISLIRIDGPILLAYVLLYFFTASWIDLSIIDALQIDWAAQNGIASKAFSQFKRYNLDAFSAGAAAFKLIISNLLFTVMLVEAIL